MNPEWPPASSKQRQPDNYRNSQRSPQFSRQSEDVTESSWWRSNVRQSEDEDWDTESLKVKQWADNVWPTDSPWDRRSQKSQQSDDDDDDLDSNSPWDKQYEDDTQSPIQPEVDDWTKYMKPYKPETFSDFSENAKAVTNILNYLLPHISHTLNISVTAEPLSSTAYLLMEYNHTYDKDLHLLRLKAVSKRAKDAMPYEVRITS